MVSAVISSTMIKRRVLATVHPDNVTSVTVGCNINLIKHSVDDEFSSLNSLGKEAAL